MCRAYYKRRLAVFSLVLAVANEACGQRPATPQRAEFWGFTGPWEDASTASVRAHGGQLGAVINGWITIDSSSALPVIPSPYLDTVRPRAGTPARMAIVTSWHGDGFHTAPIRRLAGDPRRLATAAGSIARYAQRMRYNGLVLDFESLQGSDLPTLLKVSKAIADSAHAHRVRTVAMAIPATDTEAYPARPLLGVVDALVVMLYDQHWAGSEPGPIAEPLWVRSSLGARVREVGPSRLIAALPAYGYRWRKGQATESIGYADAVRMSNAVRAPLQRDPTSQFLHARGRDGSEIWVSDAALFGTLVRECQALGLNRFAIWRLGEEDPAIWGSVVR